MMNHDSRVLNPIERFSEIVFGLIMVLTFTCAMSVAEAGKEDVHEMLVGALGCNLAWGIIDAAFYLLACLAERGRNATLLRNLHAAQNAVEARQIIASALPQKIADVLRESDFERIHGQLRAGEAPPARPRLTGQDWKGAFAVFLLVFFSTLPVILPFLFLSDAHTALRTSNVIANVMLFGAGAMLAAYAGLRRIPTGLAMVAIGSTLVGIAIALGG